MLLKIIFAIVAFCAFTSAAQKQQQFVPKDVDVFNMNYNRNQRSARNHILRSFDIVPSDPEPTWKASATLVSGNDDPEQGGGISGDISFKQWNLNSPIQVNVNISGLKPGKHAIHIHAFGDLSDGCKSTGPHFRHAIIGNIEAKEDGKSEIKFNTLGLNLFGLYGILGRSIVVHEKPSEFLKYPDLFTPESEFLDHGFTFQSEEDSVGERMACGIVTVTSNI